MADVKYQIFVSSTFADLVEERQALSRAILDMGHIPAGMELFPAADIEQLDYIKKVIDECDYYVLIVGARYGSLDPDGVSFTEREYDYAVESGKTVLAFIHANMDEVPRGKTDKDEEKYEKLIEFREKVTSGRLVKFWKTGDELAALAIVALTHAFSNSPQVGWVRADTVPTHSTMADVLRFREENDQLRKEIAQLQSRVAPHFEDAADLSHPVTINYTYKSRYGERNGAVEMSFAKLLKFLAPDLHTPTNVGGATMAMTRALREHFGTPSEAYANRTDVQNALLHLVATGHVHMWAGTTTDGKSMTGYQLTPLGTKAWQEMSYVRVSRSR